jgi:hypothetical protein
MDDCYRVLGYRPYGASDSPDLNSLGWVFHEISRTRLTSAKQMLAGIRANDVVVIASTLDLPADMLERLAARGTLVSVLDDEPQAKSSPRETTGRRTVAQPKTPRINLAEAAPHLIPEWDLDANVRAPHEVASQSQYLANWICRECGETWPAQVTNRVRHGTGCPHCNKRNVRVSKIAIKFADALAAHFGSHEPEYPVAVSWIPRQPNRPAEVDAYFGSGGVRVAFEYDGYRHAGREAVDTRKTLALLAHSDVDVVIRVRDDRLAPLPINDPRYVERAFCNRGRASEWNAAKDIADELADRVLCLDLAA